MENQKNANKSLLKNQNINNMIKKKNKTYKDKIKKTNSSKNFRKKNYNPFPISDLLRSNNQINGNNTTEIIKRDYNRVKFSLAKILKYYFYEFFPKSMIHNISTLKGNLMLINNDSISNKNVKLENKFVDVPACVIISNKKSIKDCWNNGFYGKGNLSRSEPDWTERILKDVIKKNLNVNYQQTVDNYLTKNHKITGDMDVNKNSYKFLNKLNDTFKTSESIYWNKQLLIKILDLGFSLIQDLISLMFNPHKFYNDIKKTCENIILKKVNQKIIKSSNLLNLEYLQLDLVEAFFLKYALNCLSIKNKNKVMSIDDCWNKFRNDISNPADPFILKYVAYHYYRSQGWIVKEGLKYGVDYVLYQKGPAFSHSEFAISIIPVMEDDNHNYINNLSTVHEVNCTNRVCNQVLKKLVLCYIVIPKSINLDSADCLKMYKIYEVRMKRWNPDKTRN